MSKLEIKGTRERQIFSIEGKSAIRYSRITQKKTDGKKKKWNYFPENKKKELYEKNI